MTNTTFKKALVLILASMTIASCASNPPEDQFTDEELAPVETKKAAVSASSELLSIEAELASVDAQITAAQARLTQYQMQNVADPVNQSQIAGTEAEISHYQSMKSSLSARKQILSTQSTVQ